MNTGPSLGPGGRRMVRVSQEEGFFDALVRMFDHALKLTPW